MNDHYGKTNYYLKCDKYSPCALSKLAFGQSNIVQRIIGLEVGNIIGAPRTYENLINLYLPWKNNTTT